MSAIKNISLFVPYIFPNFDKNYVAKSFKDLGDVACVDFVTKQDRTNGKTYNAAYIHFNKWYNNANNRNVQYNILENGSDRWYHDNSQYYWIVLQNTAKKYVPGERKQTIDLSGLKTPEKIVQNTVHPNTPMKTYANAFDEEFVDDTCFNECLELLREELEEWDVEASEEAIEMAELEAELEAEDANLITIDWRYVAALEQQNAFLLNKLKTKVGRLLYRKQ